MCENALFYWGFCASGAPSPKSFSKFFAKKLKRNCNATQNHNHVAQIHNRKANANQTQSTRRAHPSKTRAWSIAAPVAPPRPRRKANAKQTQSKRKPIRIGKRRRKYPPPYTPPLRQSKRNAKRSRITPTTDQEPPPIQRQAPPLTGKAGPARQQKAAKGRLSRLRSVARQRAQAAASAAGFRRLPFSPLGVPGGDPRPIWPPESRSAWAIVHQVRQRWALSAGWLAGLLRDFCELAGRTGGHGRFAGDFRQSAGGWIPSTMRRAAQSRASAARNPSQSQSNESLRCTARE